MPIGATISAVGAVASAGIGAYASHKASQAQSQAASDALAYQKGIYKGSAKNFAPYLELGKSATASLSDLYGLGKNGAAGIPEAFTQFTNLPAYQFPFQQGLRALTHNLNATGRTQSGAEAKETQNFGQGLASTYMMQNYVNPLQNFAGLGQSAAANLGQVGAQSAQAVGNSYGNLGAAQASGYVGMGNAIGGGINNLGNSLSMYSLLSRSSPNFSTSSYAPVGGGQAASAAQSWGAAYAPGGFQYNYG